MKHCKAPVSRLGWFRYYVDRFNRFELQDSAHMALFYFLLLLEDGEPPEMS